MRTALAILLLSCAVVLGQAFTFSDPAFVCQSNPPSPAGGCTTAAQDSTSTDGSSGGWFGDNSNVYQAMAIQNSNNITVCAISIALKLGGGSGSFTVAIYSDNAGVPGSLQGAASDSFAYSTLGASFALTKYPFGFTTILTANTKYWVVVHAVGDSGGAYIYQECRGLTASSLSQQQKWSTDGVSWSDRGGSTEAVFKLWQ